MKRALLSLALGLGVSLALFGLMQLMVMHTSSPIRQDENIKMVEFVRLKREAKIETKRREIPDKPPPVKPPPPPPKPMAQQTPLATNDPAPAIDMPKLDIPLSLGRLTGTAVTAGVRVAQGDGHAPNLGEGGQIAFSSHVIPLVRVPPQYPQRAASRRIEGWVKIELIIDASGEVTDAKVAEAHPPGVFDSEALKAINKWKFKPKIVNGQAVPQRALQILEFKLSK